MSDYDEEEAHYYWTLNEVLGLISQHGWDKVIEDLTQMMHEKQGGLME